MFKQNCIFYSLDFLFYYNKILWSVLWKHAHSQQLDGKKKEPWGNTSPAKHLPSILNHIICQYPFSNVIKDPNVFRYLSDPLTLKVCYDRSDPGYVMARRPVLTAKGCRQTKTPKALCYVVLTDPSSQSILLFNLVGNRRELRFWTTPTDYLGQFFSVQAPEEDVI